MKHLYIFLFYILSFSYSLFSQAWQQTSGPEGGTIRCLLVSGSTIYAGTASGIFVSSNQGASWIPINNGLNYLVINTITLTGTTLYAGTEGGGIFISTNFGFSWSPLSSLFNNDVNFIGINGSNLFACTEQGVYLSTDNGVTWTHKNTGLTSHDGFSFYYRAVSCIFFSGSDIFIGTDQGVYLSTNNGDSWIPKNTGLETSPGGPMNHAISSLKLIGSNIFAASDNGGVFISSNNGASWAPVNNGLGNQNVKALLYKGSNLFAGTDGGIFYSSDNGANWNTVNNGLYNLKVLCLGNDATNLYAGFNGSGISVSVNNGASWVQSNTGLNFSNVTSLIQNGSYIYAALKGNGVAISLNNGQNWTISNAGLTNLDVSTLSFYGSYLFAGTSSNSGVYKSSDLGSSWYLSNSGITASKINSIASLGSYLFVGTEVGVFKSTNTGISWTSSNTGLIYTNSGITYNCAVNTLLTNGSLIYAGTNYGVFVSSNNGVSWSQKNSGLTSPSGLAKEVTSIAFIGSNIFAGTTDGGVYFTSNSGNSWGQVNSGLPVLKINKLYSSGNSLMAATNSGIFVTSNNGLSWKDANIDLVNKNINSLLLTNNILLAGSSGNGVLKGNYVPSIPSIPTGQSNLCKGQLSTTYVTQGSKSIESQHSYIWAINPSIAGTLTPDNNSVTIDWSPGYSGFVYLKVKARNDFTDGPWSDSLLININSLPPEYKVTASSMAYCINANGISVKLSSSQGGNTYLLKKNNIPQGIYMDGTGSALQWDNMKAGTYSVYSQSKSTGCIVKMTDSVLITETRLPDIYTLSALNFSYCSNGNGVSLILYGSETGVNYQVFKNDLALLFPTPGNGVSLTWANMKAGTYTVIATNTASGCQSVMNGSVTFAEVAPPQAFNISASSTVYCNSTNGVEITLSGSQNTAKYQLKKNGINEGPTLEGKGSIINWSNMRAGTYTVTASLAGCQNEMNGRVIIKENGTPFAYDFSSSSNSYCSATDGISLQILSSQNGINYQLLKNNIIEGPIVIGTGSKLQWDKMKAGMYSLIATNTLTGCQSKMNNSVSITEFPSPNIYNLTSTANIYCSNTNGVSIQLSGSQTIDFNYQLKRNNVDFGGTRQGTGNALQWNNIKAGVFTMVASLGTCQSIMNGNITITEYLSPAIYTLSSDAISYCGGNNGVTLSLTGSQSAINYQLKKGEIDEGSIKPGNNSILQWNSIKSGTYKVIGFESHKVCQAEMKGLITIIENQSPDVFSITSSDTAYCAGNEGVKLKLASSQTGINYKLERNGLYDNSPLQGNGNDLSWTNIKDGRYRVMAINPNTNCQVFMDKQINIIENSVPELYVLTSSSLSYCDNTNGVELKLVNSQEGINYQLKKDDKNEGQIFTGTGNYIVWNNMKTGNYTVFAYNPNTSCQSNMFNALKIIENKAPAIFLFSGSPNFCEGTNGTVLKLSSSQTDANYQLLKNNKNEGVIRYGNQQEIIWQNLKTGIYKVIASTVKSNCFNQMEGEISVVESPLPIPFNASGEPNIYCANENGVFIKLTGSQLDVKYKLYCDEILNSTLSGNGAIVRWENLKAGRYKIIAQSLQGCELEMNNSEIVEITEKPVPSDTFNFIASPKPSYCSNEDPVTIKLSGSEQNVNYELSFNNSVLDKTGTGNELSWTKVKAGKYIVKATKDGCTVRIGNELIITENPIPKEMQLTPSNTNYCEGTDGVEIKLTGSEPNIKYQLIKDGQSLEEKNGNSLWTNILAGSYTMKARNTVTGCRFEWGKIFIEQFVLPNPQILETRNPICPNEEIICINPDIAWNYQWFYNDMKTGSDRSSINSYKSGKYVLFVIDKNTNCFNYSVALNLTVFETLSPTIRKKWGDVLVCKNVNGMFITFQWFKDDLKIEGASKQYYVEKNKLAGNSYFVEVKDNNSCILRSDKLLNLDIATKIHLYPNPVINDLNIQLSSDNTGKVTIKIFNMLGQKLKEINEVKTSYNLLIETNLEKFNPGTYFFEITLTDEIRYFEKVVIDRK